MYKSEVIYEKKFPNTDVKFLAELEKELATEGSANEETAHIPFEEIVKRIYKDMVYVVMPGRKEKAVAFIKKAVDVSELYEMNIKIEAFISHVCVTYSFNCGAGMKHLIDVIGEADDVAFFTNIDGFDIVMSLDFYTHAEYRKGRKVNP